MTVLSKDEFIINSDPCGQKDAAKTIISDIYINIFFEESYENYWVTWYYFRKWMRKRIRSYSKFENVDDLVAHLDEVPANIIGKFNLEKAYAAAPTFAKRQLVFALPDDHPDILARTNSKEKQSTGVKLREEGKAKEIAKRKGLPKEVVNSFIAAAFRKALVKKDEPEQRDNLYVEDKHLTNEWLRANSRNNNAETASGNLVSHISLFVVDKGEEIAPGMKHPKQRVITDARAANARLENEAHMELFSLECLIQRMGYAMNEKINNNQQVFALQCDLRHWFHQIKLPKRFRQHLRINLGEKGDPQYVYPFCWPMGVHMSPAIGQAATWSILLAELDNENERASELRARLGIDWKGKFDTYLQWLPLKDGGAVFVLIDNIFIVTTNEQVANAWKQRIHENCFHKERGFAATLKCINDAPGVAEIDKYFDTKAFSKKDKSNNTTIIFSGIEFGRYGRRPKDEIDAVDTFEHDANVEWHGTFRELASIFGQLMWNYRVRGESLLQKEEFMSLYSEEGFPRGDKDWDSTTIIGNENYKLLRAAYKECRKNFQDRIFVPYNEILEQNTFAIIVADAALEEDKDTQDNLMGGMWLSHEHMKKGISKPEIMSRAHGENQIAVAELQALVSTIREMHKSSKTKPDVYLVATDSMAAKGMIARGYSRVKRARELLRELMTEIGDRGLVIMYVESEKNPADAPSREKDEKEHWNDKQEKLWNEVKKQLQDHLPFACSTFSSTTKRVHNVARDNIKQLSGSRRDRE